MRTTTLQVTAAGIPLRDLHLERLGIPLHPGREAFDRFAALAVPGVYRLVLDGDRLQVTPRGPSSLRDGMPVRLLPSPCAWMRGRFPKPLSPGPYDDVRSRGVATLLTTCDGDELLESCTAALLGWDGAAFVHPPDDRPRVWSTAEEAVRRHLPVRAAPLSSRGALPLLLVNAVAGPCPLALPDRPAVPAEPIARIHALFALLTVR
jgi:hypothetical protein